MRPGRAALAGAAGAGAAMVVHTGPSIASIRALRVRVLPGLAGMGTPGHVALSFDDGPDAASTPKFLAVLDRLGWRATFFMLGAMVRRAPQLAAEVRAAGHEVALHGDEHRSHLRRTPAAVRADLRRGLDAVQEATGDAVRWFRPPYGSLSAGSVAAASVLRLRPVLWTAWGRDWRARATPASVVADINRGLAPGGTVLLHDSDCTSAPGSWKSALGALPYLADLFAARGLQVGPLGQHGVALPPRRNPRDCGETTCALLRLRSVATTVSWRK